MNYPEFAEIDGAEYEINTDYKYALACFRAINDVEISDIERAYAIIGILYKKRPENEQEALRIAIKYLQCGKENQSVGKVRDMDFEYDAQLIEASFMSDYRIDLDDSSMHWWKFSFLLEGLTDKCVLNRVRDLRNYDTSTIKNSKARQKIERAKRDVSLPEKVDPESQCFADEFEMALSQK